MRFSSPLFLALLLAFLVVLPAHAQEETLEITLESEGITEVDLVVDLEAETLPEDGFRFRFESFMHQTRRFFTFNAERRAELDRARLHRLDRKLTACSDVGDEECVTIIEERIETAEARAQKHFDKQEEIKAKWQEQFDEWRAKRNDRIEALRDKAESLKDKREELKAKRDAKRDEVRARREERMEEKREEIREKREERKEDRIERRDQRKDVIESRQQNREHLIETRSERVNRRLHEVSDQAEERNAELEAKVDSN